MKVACADACADACEVAWRGTGAVASDAVWVFNHIMRKAFRRTILLPYRGRGAFVGLGVGEGVG